MKNLSAMQSMAHRGLFAVLILTVCGAASAAGPLPVGWRTDGTGRFPNAVPPTQWSSTENVVWKTELPGRSFASPVVVGDRIFVLSDPAELLCVRVTDGEILWRRANSATDVFGPQRAQKMLDQFTELSDRKKQLQRQFRDLKKSKPDAKDEQNKLRDQLRSIDEQIKTVQRKNPVPGHRGSGNTAGTPVCDGKHVYAAFGTGIVAAYNLEGERQWIKFVEGSAIGFGHSSSPVVVGDKLIVHYHDLTALDTVSGEVAWRTEIAARHATPIAVRIGDVDVLVTPSGGVVRTSDGKVLLTERALQVSEGSQIVHDDVLYVQSRKTSAFRLPASAGETIELELSWQTTASRGRRTPSPVIHDGLLYGVTTNGILDVTDSQTGEVAYRKRLDIGNMYSSVTVAGNFVYLSSTKGATVVLEAGREYKQIARNQLESFGSNPVFIGKRMYVRGQKHLYCIGE